MKYIPPQEEVDFLLSRHSTQENRLPSQKRQRPLRSLPEGSSRYCPGTHQIDRDLSRSISLFLRWRHRRAVKKQQHNSLLVAHLSHLALNCMMLSDGSRDIRRRGGFGWVGWNGHSGDRCSLWSQGPSLDPLLVIIN